MKIKKHWHMKSILILLVFILILTGCSSNQSGKQQSLQLNWEVEDFTFINQEGQSFGLENLKGKVWIADFIFTNCQTVCLPMTSNMVRLQKQFKESGIDVELVSFTVDPMVDSPEVLKAYGESYDADFSSWHFLTGYTLDDIALFARDNFKTLVQDDPNSDQVNHGIKFFLVNQKGNVLYHYDGIDLPFDEIISDAKHVLKKGK